MAFDSFRMRLSACFGVVFAAAALIGAPARAQAPQEDTNPLNSVLGFIGMQFDKDKEDINYRARAPLVVPPRLDLPQPKQVARDPNWPKDPDAEDRRHAAAAAQRPAPQPGLNSRVELSAAEMQQNRSDLPAAGPSNDCQPTAGSPICLYTPWEILKSVTGIDGGKPNAVAVGDKEPTRAYLTEPPPGYRRATGSASATNEAPQEAPDASDAKAYARTQQHKLSVDN